jgi:hypothetical protein
VGLIGTAVVQDKSDDQVKTVPSRQDDISPSTCVAAQRGSAPPSLLASTGHPHHGCTERQGCHDPGHPGCCDFGSFKRRCLLAAFRELRRFDLFLVKHDELRFLRVNDGAPEAREGNGPSPKPVPSRIRGIRRREGSTNHVPLLHAPRPRVLHEAALCQEQRLRR